MINTSAKEVSKMLSQRVESVAKYLFPNGKKIGNEFCVGSVSGEEGKSLKIHLTGEKSGIFCDFAIGQRGDLLDLWALKHNLSIAQAISDAAQWLGYSSTSIHFAGYNPKTFTSPNLKNLTLLSNHSPVKNYLMQERKLTASTLEVFKIAENDKKEIIFPYYREGNLLQVKYLSLDRSEGKKKIRVEANCEPCLFGWHNLPKMAREITLCEGEIDAMTLYQYGVPALSVPFGGGGGAKHQWLQYEFGRLSGFDKIYLCFDNDAEGKVAVDDLIDRLGRHRCLVVELPYKDANACLQANIESDIIKNCFKYAKSLDPVELKSASLYVKEVTDEFYPPAGSEIGIKPPWEKARGKIYFRPDELSIWTGINGHGKSQFLGQIILHTLKQNKRVCIASLELKPKRFLMRLTRQAGGLSKPTQAYIQAIHEWYSDKLWIFDLVGNAKSDRLLEVFRYARQRYGIEVFVIDSFMKLDISEDDYKAQKTLIEKLCDFKNEHNCHVHLVVHPRKGLDESKLPGKLDAKGTGAITDLADNCFTVWRNKNKQESIQKLKVEGKTLPEDLLNKVDALWVCDKQRNGEWEGKIGLWFHAESFQYLNYPTQKPIRYVEYSNPINPF